jgi:hypothetical protein
MQTLSNLNSSQSNGCGVYLNKSLSLMLAISLGNKKIRGVTLMICNKTWGEKRR